MSSCLVCVRILHMLCLVVPFANYCCEYSKIAALCSLAGVDWHTPTLYGAVQQLCALSEKSGRTELAGDFSCIRHDPVQRLLQMLYAEPVCSCVRERRLQTQSYADFLLCILCYCCLSAYQLCQYPGWHVALV